jgi:RNA 2',3'-cyclic 3'-phosphodiesterase
MRRIRAFVAVNLPIALVQKVVAHQSELRKAARAASLGVAWVPAPNLHVTLKFLGDIPEESVHAIRDLFTARLASRPAVPVVVRGAGAFPSRARPRVLWVGLESPERGLEALAGDLDGWLSELGFEREARPFHPHLTLGRVRQGAADILGPLEQVTLGEAVIDEVVLYESVLQRSGAEYTPHLRVPLLAPKDRPPQAAERRETAAAAAEPTSPPRGEE